MVSYFVQVRDSSGGLVDSGYVADGSNQFTFTGGVASEVYRATVTSISAADVTSTSPSSSDAGAPNPASATSAVIVLAPSADQDGDGQSNFLEDLAGTNPLQPGSVFKVLACQKAGNDMTVTFSSVAGKSYQLETGTALAPDVWSDAGDPVVATGASTVLTHPGGAGDPKRFYRVRVLP